MSRQSLIKTVIPFLCMLSFALSTVEAGGLSSVRKRAEPEPLPAVLGPRPVPTAESFLPDSLNVTEAVAQRSVPWDSTAEQPESVEELRQERRKNLRWTFISAAIGVAAWTAVTEISGGVSGWLALGIVSTPFGMAAVFLTLVLVGSFKIWRLRRRRRRQQKKG